MKTILILLLGLQLCSLAHEAHEGLRHWEVASSDPDRIFLTFDESPTSSRTVSWRTDASVKEGYAEVTEALSSGSMGQFAVQYKAETSLVDLSRERSNKQGGVHYHSVSFKGLKADTLYAYRVGDGGKYQSEWIQFRTSSEEVKPFEFVYFGDAQNLVLPHWSRVIRQCYQTAPHAVFAVHCGDLINKAHHDGEWAEWFKAGGFLHSQWAGVPVAGNHEYRALQSEGEKKNELSIQWNPQFNPPIGEGIPESLFGTVYSYRVQGTQFVVLNSNEAIEEQVPFLRKELEKDAQWKVVVYHHSMYSPRPQRSKGSPQMQKMRQLWKPLFKKYDVDLVLQGHDHSYTRGGTFKNEEDFQTLFVTSVSGPKQYPIDQETMQRYEDDDGLFTTNQGEHTQFYHVVQVAVDDLTFKSYTATGDLYDEVRISKDRDKGVKTIREIGPKMPARTFSNTVKYSYQAEMKALVK